MQNLIQSPLNYTGGKFRLLPQILPLFPKNVRTLVDLFCGGGNVGINAPASRVIYNDANHNVAGLLRLFREWPEDEIVERAHSIIRSYGLSLSKDHGYGHYGCESSSGLGNYNRKGFQALKDAYNSAKNTGADAAAQSLMLFVLIAHAFNNQIRFNSSGSYNLPVGKRDFNRKMEWKLRRFIRALQAQSCEITGDDFRNFNMDRLGARDLVYADPPYLITRAPYNENGGWDENAENDLLDLLDALSERNVNFALSNALKSKGLENRTLKMWLRARKYRTHHLKSDYSNSSYHRLERRALTDEVLVTNYEV